MAEDFAADIEKVKKIAIVPGMLEVICRSTGMGFAAVARVTEDRWIACEVRDEIGFGLQSGGELPIKTTICNEIRQTRQPVVFDNVALSPQYRSHPTPELYGLQSYISMPIILNTGEFFGTLCAIDPNPHKVEDIRITGMFTLFAQLLAFHLQAVDTIEQGQEDLKSVNQELSRFEHLTYHSLREPVRKISLFSDRLIGLDVREDYQKFHDTAKDINRLSGQLAGMLRQIDPGSINS